MANKDFKVKNKLVISGLTNAAGVLLAEGHTVDSHTNLVTQYGGTGTTTSPTSGQILYSSSGTTYAPTTLTSLDVKGASYSADAPSSPVVGQIWVESDSSADSFDPNIINRQSFTATAGQTVFTTSQTFIEGYEQVYFNGMLLLRTTDYATSNLNTVTLGAAAAVNDIVEVISITNLNSYSPNPYSSISSNTNLAAGYRYYVTSSSALTLTLPANPSRNDQISILDASGNAATYNITIARNSKLINGNAGNFIIDSNGFWASLIYTGSTYGWKVG